MDQVDFDWPPNVGIAQSVGEHCVHLLAPNADAFTYEGTNTWIIGGNPGGRCLVIDPGSADFGHLNAIMRVVKLREWKVCAIAATHLHDDHTDGAQSLANLSGADVFTFEGVGGFESIRDGDTFDLVGNTVQILHTPGHTDDSVSFNVARDSICVTGDTVLQQRSSAVYGDLGDFFRTLNLLHSLSEEDDSIFLPGHGPIIKSPKSVIDQVSRIRWRRLEQVAELVDNGFDTTDAVTDRLYPNIEPERRVDAEQYIASNLKYLAEQKVPNFDKVSKS